MESEDGRPEGEDMAKRCLEVEKKREAWLGLGTWRILYQPDCCSYRAMAARSFDRFGTGTHSRSKRQISQSDRRLRRAAPRAVGGNVRRRVKGPSEAWIWDAAARWLTSAVQYSTVYSIYSALDVVVQLSSA